MLSFEKLGATYRAEVESDHLQVLEPDFAAQVEAYLKERCDARDKLTGRVEREKINRELNSVTCDLGDMWYRRMNKIISAAEHAVAGEEYSTDGMLPDEKVCFEGMVVALRLLKQKLIEPTLKY